MDYLILGCKRSLGLKLQPRLYIVLGFEFRLLRGSKANELSSRIQNPRLISIVEPKPNFELVGWELKAPDFPFRFLYHVHGQTIFQMLLQHS